MLFVGAAHSIGSLRLSDRGTGCTLLSQVSSVSCDGGSMKQTFCRGPYLPMGLGLLTTLSPGILCSSEQLHTHMCSQSCLYQNGFPRGPEVS